MGGEGVRPVSQRVYHPPPSPRTLSLLTLSVRNAPWSATEARVAFSGADGGACEQRLRPQWVLGHNVRIES